MGSGEVIALYTMPRMPAPKFSFDDRTMPALGPRARPLEQSNPARRYSG